MSEHFLSKWKNTNHFLKHFRLLLTATTKTTTTTTVNEQTLPSSLKKQQQELTNKDKTEHTYATLVHPAVFRYVM